MAINYLIDTNVFLEILLNQEKRENCKTFLNSNVGQISISDFSLHSIGVILFRNKKFEVFNAFIKDILPKTELVTLHDVSYYTIVNVANQYNLDFDDAYQNAVAKFFNRTIVTMDADFRRAQSDVPVYFL